MANRWSETLGNEFAVRPAREITGGAFVPWLRRLLRRP